MIQFALSILELNLVAAGKRDRLLSFDLLFKFLEIQVLISKNLHALNRFVLESHHTRAAVINAKVTIRQLLIERILLCLNFFNFSIHILKECLRATAFFKLLINCYIDGRNISCFDLILAYLGTKISCVSCLRYNLRKKSDACLILRDLHLWRFKITL